MAVTFTDCVNTGTITWSYPQGGTIHETDKGGCGTIIGSKGGSNTVTVNGTCTAAADKLAVGNYFGTKGAEGLNFATVDGNVATFVALDTNKTLKVMAKGATATYAFEAPGVLTFVTNMCEAVFAVTAADTLDLAEVPTVDGVTFTATAKPTDPWPAPTEDKDVAKALQDAGFSATAQACFTTVAQYNAFKTYCVETLQIADPAATAGAVKDNALVSYALDCGAINKTLTSDDVTIDAFADGKITIAIEGVTVGTVNQDIIAKVLTVKGNDKLAEFATANVTATGYAGVDGKVDVTVAPASSFENPTAFFYQAEINK